MKGQWRTKLKIEIVKRQLTRRALMNLQCPTKVPEAKVLVEVEIRNSTNPLKKTEITDQ